MLQPSVLSTVKVISIIPCSMMRRICLRRCFFCCRCRRWMCLRHGWGPTACFCLLAIVSLFISITSFAYAFRHQLYDTFIKCSEEASQNYIRDYCQLYKEGKITGSLCGPLCEAEQVKFSKCTDFHAGKRVDIMTCSNFCVPGETVAAVLKSSNDNISAQLSNHPDILPEGVQSENFVASTNERIQKMLYWELGFQPFSSETNMMEVMWEKHYTKFTRSLREKRAAFRTIMMLMDETEYKMVKAMESSGIVPHIYGTCGPLYLQESCPPGLLDVPVISLGNGTPAPASWQQKATAVIQLLGLIKRLEQDFSEVLHLCDVKGSNFGVCADGSVKVIDADNVFFHTRMMETFNASRCTDHGDCNFFDCGGWCMVNTGRCYPVITNNNLQTVCRDVLTGKLPHLVNWGVLLSDAPASVASKLNAALEECLEQTSVEYEIPIYKPPVSLLTKLIHLLVQSVAEEDAL